MRPMEDSSNFLIIKYRCLLKIIQIHQTPWLYYIMLDTVMLIKIGRLDGLRKLFFSLLLLLLHKRSMIRILHATVANTVALDSKFQWGGTNTAMVGNATAPPQRYWQPLTYPRLLQCNTKQPQISNQGKVRDDSRLCQRCTDTRTGKTFLYGPLYGRDPETFRHGGSPVCDLHSHLLGRMKKTGTYHYP